jgi:WD40 repeat protein
MGLVYRIVFSTFDDTVFVSCGGDCTVRIWKTDRYAPLLTMNSGYVCQHYSMITNCFVQGVMWPFLHCVQSTVFDVACSLYFSTVFISVTQEHVQVWDLSLNTLEPVVQHTVPEKTRMRKVAFSGSLNVRDNNLLG